MKMLKAVLVALAMICGVGFAADEGAPDRVVFVCEHGVVKSRMAATYFNELAARRGLRWRAVSRGSAPDSPAKIDAADVADAARIVTIGATLPAQMRVEERRIERWDDVPSASTNYAAAQKSIEAHAAELLGRLSRQSDRR